MTSTCIPVELDQRDKDQHSYKFMLFNTFLREREEEEILYRKRIEEMCKDPELGKQYQAYLKMLFIDQLIMKTLIMVTQDLEKLHKLPADGLETCIQQVQKEIIGLKQMPDENDALKEAELFEKFLEKLLIFKKPILQQEKKQQTVIEQEQHFEKNCVSQSDFRGC